MKLNQGPNDDVNGPDMNKIPPGLCLLPSFPCSPLCMLPAVLLSSSLWPLIRSEGRSPGSPWFHGGQQTRFVKNTIQYDSKSKHSKRRQTVNWTWEVACWFSFSLFLKISAVTYTTACARTVLFLKGISAAIFSLRSCTACARVLSLCMLAPARGGPPATTAPALSDTRRQRRKVDKCRVADKKQTNKPTNQQTNTHYSFIGIDELWPVVAATYIHV